MKKVGKFQISLAKRNRWMNAWKLMGRGDGWRKIIKKFTSPEDKNEKT